MILPLIDAELRNAALSSFRFPGRLTALEFTFSSVNAARSGGLKSIYIAPMESADVWDIATEEQQMTMVVTKIEVRIWTSGQ
jgi:hypothetical protein